MPDPGDADQVAQRADQAKSTFDQHLIHYQALARQCARIYRDQPPSTAWAALATALTEDLAGHGVGPEFAVGLLTSLLLRFDDQEGVT